jgi:ABC-type multidrug transport system fused ATPase/permease subunit
MVRQSAEVENSMNGVERVLYYANHIEQEAAYELPKLDPAKTWPEKGEIVAENMVVSYRPELPPVLKDVSMHIGGGEHIGIIGRTGAGKSTSRSLCIVCVRLLRTFPVTLVLFRIIELLSGKVEIDGVDISKIGLRALRSSLSSMPQIDFSRPLDLILVPVIPQDPLLFNGACFFLLVALNTLTHM